MSDNARNSASSCAALDDQDRVAEKIRILEATVKAVEQGRALSFEEVVEVGWMYGYTVYETWRELGPAALRLLWRRLVTGYYPPRLEPLDPMHEMIANLDLQADLLHTVGG